MRRVDSNDKRKDVPKSANVSHLFFWGGLGRIVTGDGPGRQDQGFRWGIMFLSEQAPDAHHR